ncbi:MAG: phosphatidate cytidylyltransferase [Armatimonadetes bacterium]|nr:phosphatidate cytidylyltransferase [Armatimonadota bacterium]
MLRRVVTGVLGGALALWALLTTHSLPIVVCSSLVFLIGFMELVKIAGLEDRPWPTATIGVLCLVVPLTVARVTPPGSWQFWAIVWAAYLAGCFGVIEGFRRKYATPMSSGWLAAPLATIVVTHQQTPLGTGTFVPNATLMLLLPIWAGDTFALVVGKAIGRHKLAPTISPGKTWEGAMANLAACVVTSLIVGVSLKIPIVASALAGVTSGVLGQVGDLAQSYLKRVTGLKDSGGVLPGHGGILDRLDSLLLSAVPCSTVLCALSPGLYHSPLWP